MATALENTGPAEFVNLANGHPAPPSGLQVNGCTLIAFTGKGPASDGSYAYGVGVFHNPNNDYHPFVVWTLILRPASEGKVWVVESGDYCATMASALEAYERRGGVEEG